MALLNAGAELMLNAMEGAAIAAATKYLSLYVGQPVRQRHGGERDGLRSTGAHSGSDQPSADNVLSVNMGEWDDSANASWGTPTWVGFHSALTGGTLVLRGGNQPGAV